MKVHKMISLDADTAKIASKMGNFSQWVRISLRSWTDEGTSIADEIILRKKWARAAHMLAATLVEHGLVIDKDYKGSVDELIHTAMSQARLEDFE